MTIFGFDQNSGCFLLFKQAFIYKYQTVLKIEIY